MDERRQRQRQRRELRLSGFKRQVGIVFFIFVAGLALMGLIAKDRPFSDSENRTLAQRPALTADSLQSGGFFADYSDYLADQFWGRDGWISIDTFGVRLLGRHDVNGVYVGKKGCLFSAPEAPDEDIQSRKITAVNTFAMQYPDIDMKLMLVPGAASVLTERLPANAPVRNQLADISAVQLRVDPAVECIDVTAALLTHSGEDIYYRTDHHWTSLGAYYAFTAAASSLAPDMGIPGFNVMTVSTSFEGTLASKAGIHRVKDSIQVYIPQDTGSQFYVNYPDAQKRVTSMYVSDMLEEKDQYAVFFGGNHPVVEIYTTVNNGRNLLVFKDSYANCFMQFLTPYYDRIVMIDPRYYYGDLSTAMTAYGVTDVLFLYSADTWMTDTSLADVLETGAPKASADDGGWRLVTDGAAASTAED